MFNASHISFPPLEKPQRFLVMKNSLDSFSVFGSDLSCIGQINLMVQPVAAKVIFISVLLRILIHQGNAGRLIIKETQMHYLHTKPLINCQKLSRGAIHPPRNLRHTGIYKFHGYIHALCDLFCCHAIIKKAPADHLYVFANLNNVPVRVINPDYALSP